MSVTVRRDSRKQVATHLCNNICGGDFFDLKVRQFLCSIPSEAGRIPSSLMPFSIDSEVSSCFTTARMRSCSLNTKFSADQLQKKII